MVWGRGVVAWVGALFLKSLLVNLCPVLLASGLAVGPQPLRTLIGIPRLLLSDVPESSYCTIPALLMGVPQVPG